MKRKFIAKKIGWAVIIGCLVFVIGLASYFLGIAAEFDSQKVSSIVGFVAENTHTGLVAPMSQIAFNNQNTTGGQFASNTQNQNQDKQGEGGRTVALNGIPPVLFDISVQPIFGENNTVVLLLWTTFFVLLLLFAASLIYKAYKKAKLEKIKKN